MTKRKPGSTTPPRKVWSPEEIEILCRLYPSTHSKVIADRLGISISQVYAKAKHIGVAKHPDFVREHCQNLDPAVGVPYRFAKGHASWNKGMKGVTGHHPNCRRTQFKKGEMHGAAQHNYVPIGSLRLSKDGYLERKVTDEHPVPARRWVGEHRLVWEAANGPVPPGHVVCFLPGRRTADPQLITIDAVELVSRADLARRNSLLSKDPELAKLIQLKGAIARQVNRIARETQEQRHEQ